MKRKFFPSTPLGRWTIGLMLLFLILNIIGTIMSFIRPAVNDTFSSNWSLNLIISIGIASGVCYFIVGIISMIKSHEMSVLVIVITIFGGLLLLFLLGELLVFL